MCLYPKLLKNKKYTITKKNNGNVPVPIDERLLLVPTKCGKCIECMKSKAREWQIRLTEDIRHNKNAIFVTLTFSNESIKELYNDLMNDYEITPEGYELDNLLATKGVRRFLERWRKKYKKSIRHWLITELGKNGTENIHLHGILWESKDKLEEIRKIWKYGYIYPRENEVHLNYVNERTANYITKYIHKQDENHTQYTPKMLTSEGIGKGYVTRHDSKSNKYNGTNTNETYRTRTGHKISLPIYWRNKIYTETEREQLWLQKLNKQERWIRGEKIDISKGYEEYDNALKYHRREAKKLGYNDDSKNWNKIKYENSRRKLNLQKRIK